jgi:hypothetical protein
MESFESGAPSEECPCVVRISDSEIVVSYEDRGRQIAYKGPQISHGHFKLASTDNGGNATLHRSPDSEWLEGAWTEGGHEGMWRIELIED